MNGQIEKVVREINGGVFANIDYSIPAKTYVRKGATDGSTAVNPLWNAIDRVRIERTNVQINLGVIYDHAINGRLERRDIEPLFEASEMAGKVSHIQPHKNLCQNADRTKTYLRYMPMHNTNSTSRFVLDGQDVTEILKPFQSIRNNESKKQTEAGLEVGQQIEWRTLDLNNITALRVLGMEVTH